MAFEAERLGKPRRSEDAAELVRAARALGLAIGAGMKLDNWRAETLCRFDLALLGIDEQRHPDAGLAQPGDEIPEPRRAADKIEPTFGGQLAALFGNEASGMRPVPARDLEHFGRCRHFEIERQAQLANQPRDVLV